MWKVFKIESAVNRDESTHWWKEETTYSVPDTFIFDTVYSKYFTKKRKSAD